MNSKKELKNILQKNTWLREGQLIAIAICEEGVVQAVVKETITLIILREDLGFPKIQVSTDRSTFFYRPTRIKPIDPDITDPELINLFI